MTTSIDFYFDFGSPNAWLSHSILPGIAERTGASLVYKPFLLGGVFKAVGNQSPMQSFGHLPSKMAWMGQATERFVARHGMPYASNPHFPVNTLKMMRGAFWVRGSLGEEAFMTYVDAMFRCMWVESKKMDDEDEIRAAVTAAGLDVDAFFAGIADPEVKQQLIDATTAAAEAGVFGAPTCVVGDQVFFGKDDIETIEPWLALD